MSFQEESDALAPAELDIQDGDVRLVGLHQAGGCVDVVRGPTQVSSPVASIAMASASANTGWPSTMMTRVGLVEVCVTSHLGRHERGPA